MTTIRRIDATAPQISTIGRRPILKWAIDPQTGKPAARWTVERPEPLPVPVLSLAA